MNMNKREAYMLDFTTDHSSFVTLNVQFSHNLDNFALLFKETKQMSYYKNIFSNNQMYFISF